MKPVMEVDKEGKRIKIHKWAFNLVSDNHEFWEFNAKS
jgi:hypothetical protein